ncbi:MAG: hypothetical protein ACT4NX_01900 [Deltaproteobacteria bacterium]
MPKHGEHEHEEDPKKSEKRGKDRVGRREPSEGRDPNHPSKEDPNKTTKIAGEINDPGNDNDPPAANPITGNGEYQIVSKALHRDGGVDPQFAAVAPVRGCVDAAHIYEQTGDVLDAAGRLGLDPQFVAGSQGVYDVVSGVLNDPNLENDDQKRQALIDAGYSLATAPINREGVYSDNGFVERVAQQGIDDDEPRDTNKKPKDDKPQNPVRNRKDREKGAESCLNVILDHPKRFTLGAALVGLLITVIATISALLSPKDKKSDDKKDDDETKDPPTVDPAWQVLLDKDKKGDLVAEVQKCLTDLQKRDEAAYWQSLISEVEDGTLECLSPEGAGAKKTSRMPYEIQQLVVGFMFELQKKSDGQQNMFEVKDGETREEAVNRARGSVKPPFPVNRPSEGADPDPVPMWQAIADMKTLKGSDMGRRNRLLILRSILASYLADKPAATTANNSIKGEMTFLFETSPSGGWMPIADNSKLVEGNIATQNAGSINSDIYYQVGGGGLNGILADALTGQLDEVNSVLKKSYDNIYGAGEWTKDSAHPRSDRLTSILVELVPGKGDIASKVSGMMYSVGPILGKQGITDEPQYREIYADALFALAAWNEESDTAKGDFPIGALRITMLSCGIYGAVVSDVNALGITSARCIIQGLCAAALDPACLAAAKTVILVNVNDKDIVKGDHRPFKERWAFTQAAEQLGATVTAKGFTVDPSKVSGKSAGG